MKNDGKLTIAGLETLGDEDQKQVNGGHRKHLHIHWGHSTSGHCTPPGTVVTVNGQRYVTTGVCG